MHLNCHKFHLAPRFIFLDFSRPFNSKAKSKKNPKKAKEVKEEQPKVEPKLLEAKKGLGDASSTRLKKRRSPKSSKSHHSHEHSHEHEHEEGQEPKVAKTKIAAAQNLGEQLQANETIQAKVDASFGNAVINYPKLDPSKDVVMLHYFPPEFKNKEDQKRGEVLFQKYMDEARKAHGHGNIVVVTSKRLPGTEEKPSTQDDFKAFQERAEKVLKNKFNEELKFSKIALLLHFKGDVKEFGHTNLDDFFDGEAMNKYIKANKHKVQAFNFTNIGEAKEAIEGIWQSQVKPVVKRIRRSRSRSGRARGSGSYAASYSANQTKNETKASAPTGKETYNESRERFDGKRVAVFSDSHGQGLQSVLKKLVNPDSYKVKQSQQIEFAINLIKNNNKLVQNVDAVFVMFGGNDIRIGKKTAKDYMKKLDEFIAAVREANKGRKMPKIIVGQVMPLKHLGTKADSQKRINYNKEIAKGVTPGGEQFTPFIYREFVEDKNNKGFLHSDFSRKTSDPHANKEGYKRIAAVFAKRFLKPTVATEKLIASAKIPDLPGDPAGFEKTSNPDSSFNFDTLREAANMGVNPEDKKSPKVRTKYTKKEQAIFKDIEKSVPLGVYDVILSFGTKNHRDSARWAAKLALMKADATLISSGGTTSKLKLADTTIADEQGKVFKAMGVPASRFALDRQATDLKGNIENSYKYLREVAKKHDGVANVIIVSNDAADSDKATLQLLAYHEKLENSKDPKKQALADFKINVTWYHPPEKLV